jgi:CheY-like chemotaxis protein
LPLIVAAAENLVVDDTGANRALVEEILSLEGNKVVTANSGAEALSLAIDSSKWTPPGLTALALSTMAVS